MRAPSGPIHIRDQTRAATAAIVIVAGVWLALLACVATPLMTRAEGDVAIGGTFYAQDFQIARGETYSSPDAYILVYNEGASRRMFSLTSATPPEVEIEFSEDTFELDPGEGRKVHVTVSVSVFAQPGEYDVIARAAAARDPVESQISLATAVAQKARLTIVGESATVIVAVVGSYGEAVVSQVRLFRWIDGSRVQFGVSENGRLVATIPPGYYMVSAYIGGRLVATQDFAVAPNQTRHITLVAPSGYVAWIPSVHVGSHEVGQVAHQVCIPIARHDGGDLASLNTTTDDDPQALEWIRALRADLANALRALFLDRVTTHQH